MELLFPVWMLLLLLSMAQRCEYAENNTYGKIICTVGENRLCIFQRYCSKASEWQNSKAFSTCERRRDMAKNKNRAIKIENEQVENVMEYFQDIGVFSVHGRGDYI